MENHQMWSDVFFLSNFDTFAEFELRILVDGLKLCKLILLLIIDWRLVYHLKLYGPRCDFTSMKLKLKQHCS